MKHHKIQFMLSELIDGNLSSGDEKIVRQHLATCANCRDLYRSFQELRSFAKNRPPVVVRPRFAQRVLAEYNSRREGKIWQLFDIIPKPVVTVGLAFSIVLMGLFVSPLMTPRQDTFESEFVRLFDGISETNQVTDDQALAIALNADAALALGE